MSNQQNACRALIQMPRHTKCSGVIGYYALKIEVERATNDGRQAIVMMDAEWCGICQRFKRLLTHPRLKKVLGKVNLLAVDVDEWGPQALRDGGFDFRKIPAFFQLTGPGGPKGKPMTSASWKNLSPEHVAQSFKTFLNRSHGDEAF